MGKAKVTIVLDKDSGATLTDITASNDDECDRARRVLEAAKALLGLKSEDTRDDEAGPGQVEEELLPEKLKH